MNIVARSFPLETGDEVLSNNHEYGAVNRIWSRRCSESGAKLNVCQLPAQFESQQQIVDCLADAATDKTRLVIISHITSPTALVMPVREIVQRFHEMGIAVCVDGPHAPAQIDVDISQLGCDFYTASCHKWLCATLGKRISFCPPGPSIGH